jgi:outer membrane protein OmpA-like peptidoglycan-associated protein
MRNVLSFLGAALVLAPAAGWSQGLPLGFQWELDGGEIRMFIVADDRLEELRVEVEAAGNAEGGTFTRSELDTGDTWSMTLPAPSVTTTYSLAIDAVYAGEPGSLTYAFTAEMFAELDFDVDTSTWDPDAHAFSLTMNQPAERVEIAVRGESGRVIAERVIELGGVAAGLPIRVSWTQDDERVLLVDVRAVATSGSWASRQYVPWEVELEPVRVNFATGSAEIPDTDVPVLEARLAEIERTVAGVREWVDVQLYVAGYTDTVGNDADNQRLSEQRARSLGNFMEEHGVDIPIFYQGFGESALAVQTADGVDEPANRRALFILTTRPPTGTESIPRGDWNDL